MSSPAPTIVEKYRIAILLMVFDRYDYTRRCLDTLSRSRMPGVKLLITDDCSTDPRIRPLIEAFDLPGAEVERWFFPKNLGNPNFVVKKALRHFQRRYKGFDYFGVMDNDMIFRPEWLEYLLAQCEAAEALGLDLGFRTTFNATGRRSGGGAPLLALHRTETGFFGLKDRVGGAQILFRPDLIRRLGWFRGRGSWDRKWSRACQKKGLPMLVTLPSKSQHIGAKGFHATAENFDQAFDFGSDWDVE